MVIRQRGNAGDVAHPTRMDPIPHHIKEPPLITAVTDISTLTYTMTYGERST